MVLVQSAPEVQVKKCGFLQILDDLTLLVVDSEFAHQVQELNVRPLAQLPVNLLFQEAILIVATTV